MSKGEHNLVVLWSFVASLAWLIYDYREESAVTFIMAAIVWFYVNYALGVSFIFVTNGIFKLYKKWRGENACHK